jgi:hypothetical protein
MQQLSLSLLASISGIAQAQMRVLAAWTVAA